MVFQSVLRVARGNSLRRCFVAVGRHFSTASPDSSLVDARNAPSDFDPVLAVVYGDFITNSEGEALVQDITKRMKRRRYEKGHWDAVITDYKEVELFDPEMNVPSQQVIQRVRQQIVDVDYVDGETVEWLPCHAIDLKRDGELKAHVDSVRYSGGVVAGISLLSSSIMRLKPDSESYREDGSVPDGWVDLYLPPLSLYVLSGVCRYKYSHELLPSGSVFELQHDASSPVTVERDHRLSVIFRDAKQDD